MKDLLLVNLGTPTSPNPKDVKRYLTEFLTDPRVIDFPWLKRNLLVRGIIIPRRYKESARSYQEIWTEEGSPLLVYGRQVQTLLQKRLGTKVNVELAMRYQQPSIESALDRLQNSTDLTILPLFPQYASATTGSVYDKVMEVLTRRETLPRLRFINHFFDHPMMIKAYAKQAQNFDLDSYDAIVFSFHGLPVRQLKRACSTCNPGKGCCEVLDEKNRECYAAQSYATAKGIAKALGITSYEVCFQSRLGREEWLQPYASNLIERLAREGKKRLLFFSPAFICDCLETVYEIAYEYNRDFQKLGGERVDLVPSLNADPDWIEALADIADV